MKRTNKNYIFKLKEKSKDNTLSIFCFDSMSISEALLVLVQQVFDEETITSLIEYGEVLRGIRNRLISEGYVYTNGKFYKNDYNEKTT